MFQTRMRRLLVVVFFGLLLIFLGVATRPLWRGPILLNYKSVASESIDIQSPTGRTIIDFDSAGAFPCLDGAGTRTYKYRGAFLCDDERIDDAGHKMRVSYFETKVDSMYSAYWSALIEAVFWSFVFAIAAVGALIACWFATTKVARWVVSGS